VCACVRVRVSLFSTSVHVVRRTKPTQTRGEIHGSVCFLAVELGWRTAIKSLNVRISCA
jgi:hypothetical protein